MAMSRVKSIVNLYPYKMLYLLGFIALIILSISIDRVNASYNYAPYFTATGTNHISIPDDPSLRLTRFTVAAWFKTSMTSNTDIATIVNKGGFGSDGSSVADMNYGIWLTGSKQGVQGMIQAGFENANGADYFVTSSNRYNDDQWHYAVVTYDGNVLRLYIDGTLVASRSTNAIPDHNWNKPLTIGKDSNSNSRYFTGNIDEIRVYNRALSEQEVIDAYNGRFSNDGLVYHIGTNYISEFNIAIVGDFGCTTNTSSVVRAIAYTDPELVIGLGDYSYTTSPSCWYEKIATIEDKMHDPTTIVMGNHETPTGSNYYLNIEGRNDLLNRFNITQTYYSFNYANVHFLILDTESPYHRDSQQYTFASNDLILASNNSSINWIIVSLHKPLYTSPTKHTALTSFRDLYQPLFDQYGVDLVLQAHNHNYERSKPLKYNSIITSNQISSYQDYYGEIYITVGTGGKSLYNFSGQANYSVKQIVKYGFLEINIKNNGKTLEGKFYDASRNLLDIFTINKG